jgi:hypothetical protein
MEDLDSMSYSQRDELQALMRSKYAVHFKELVGERAPAGTRSHEPTDGEERAQPIAARDADDPDIIDTDPSPNF